MIIFLPFPKKRKRDPKLRETVAVAYHHQCAVCGFNLMLEDSSVANEAAHLKWHAYEGPDIVPKGMLLCNLHHMTEKSIIVTHELYRPERKKRIPIPNACRKFNLPYKNAIELLRRIGVSIGLR